jgi:hypothetical protein
MVVKLTVAPLTPDRWPDLEAIFNARGCSVARGCWFGAKSMYDRAGFKEVARRKPARPVVRLKVR